MERIAEQLERERPWNDISALDGDLELLRAAYATERTRLLAWQEQETTQRRDLLKRRTGFSTLSAKQSTGVLRPFDAAQSDTTAEAIYPTLASLEDPFLIRLARAEEEANDLLDAILSQSDDVVVERIDLGLQNRELKTEEDVKALVSEVEDRLLTKVRAGVRVRLK